MHPRINLPVLLSLSGPLPLLPLQSHKGLHGGQQERQSSLHLHKEDCVVHVECYTQSMPHILGRISNICGALEGEEEEGAGTQWNLDTLGAQLLNVLFIKHSSCILPIVNCYKYMYKYKETYM